MALVLPGDVIPTASSSVLKLGPGLLQLPSTATKEIIATRAGILNQTTNSASFWVDSNSRRVRSPGVFGAKSALNLIVLSVVCPSGTGKRDRRRDGALWRW